MFTYATIVRVHEHCRDVEAVTVVCAVHIGQLRVLCRHSGALARDDELSTARRLGSSSRVPMHLSQDGAPVDFGAEADSLPPGDGDSPLCEAVGEIYTPRLAAEEQRLRRRNLRERFFCAGCE